MRKTPHTIDILINTPVVRGMSFKELRDHTISSKTTHHPQIKIPIIQTESESETTLSRSVQRNTPIPPQRPIRQLLPLIPRIIIRILPQRATSLSHGNLKITTLQHLRRQLPRNRIICNQRNEWMRNSCCARQRGDASLRLHVDVGVWSGGKVLDIGAWSYGFLRCGFPVLVDAHAFVVVG